MVSMTQVGVAKGPLLPNVRAEVSGRLGAAGVAATVAIASISGAGANSAGREPRQRQRPEAGRPEGTAGSGGRYLCHHTRVLLGDRKSLLMPSCLCLCSRRRCRRSHQQMGTPPPTPTNACRSWIRMRLWLRSNRPLAVTPTGNCEVT